MNFASALFSLKRGFKIKRKDWIGYWQLENDKVMIHCKDGKVINLADSDDIVFTLENAACDDWEVITTVDNVGLPYNPEIKKKDSLTIPVDKFYPKIGIDGDTWWKYQPTCTNEKDECAFCIFDGTEWKPAEIAKDQETNVKLSDYKFCYKYKGKWIPWDRMNLEKAKEKTTVDVKTVTLSTAKKPVQESGINIGTISTSEGLASHNYEIYNKAGINSEKSTSVQYNPVVSGIATERSSVLVGRGITDAGDRKAVEKQCNIDSANGLTITDAGNLGRTGYSQPITSNYTGNNKPVIIRTGEGKIINPDQIQPEHLAPGEYTDFNRPIQ